MSNEETRENATYSWPRKKQRMSDIFHHIDGHSKNHFDRKFVMLSNFRLLHNEAYDRGVYFSDLVYAAVNLKVKNF